LTALLRDDAPRARGRYRDDLLDPGTLEDDDEPALLAYGQVKKKAAVDRIG
jgi:hypothetical protein